MPLTRRYGYAVPVTLLTLICQITGPRILESATSSLTISILSGSRAQLTMQRTLKSNPIPTACLLSSPVVSRGSRMKHLPRTMLLRIQSIDLNCCTSTQIQATINNQTTLSPLGAYFADVTPELRHNYLPGPNISRFLIQTVFADT
ncbi:hypothetical protein GALMADRAFT_820405 [Galerina marginata CBS 339.88]|uniref:Uncharacterized protein n=1 Tax=Galerina marginata (strain CBS 339.88) TaxID=685588 RepID=A0A067TGQ0_GALM3|nr:hypothetical protein GALMADRAFT_820405 [Galerina marginata CBS 339.88]